MDTGRPEGVERGIDRRFKLWYILRVKGCEKDTRAGKIPREEPVAAKALYPCLLRYRF